MESKMHYYSDEVREALMNAHNAALAGGWTLIWTPLLLKIGWTRSWKLRTCDKVLRALTKARQSYLAVVKAIEAQRDAEGGIGGDYWAEYRRDASHAEKVAESWGHHEKLWQERMSAL